MHLKEDLEKAVEADIAKALDAAEKAGGKPPKCDDLYHELGHVSVDDFRAVFRRVSDARVKAKAELN